MNKSTKVTLLFVLIFVVGVLGFVASINSSLNNTHYFDFSEDLAEEVPSATTGYIR